MAKISQIIDDITGKTEQEQKLKERFSFLQKMAEGKTEQFKSDLKVMLSNKESVGALEIVGDKAFFYSGGQHVNISDSCDDAIMGAVDDFFSGGAADVKEGFRRIVKQGLAGLIGDTSMGDATQEMFFVFPENYAIVRADVKAYKYNFSSAGVFSDNVENVFVYSMCKSIVDHRKVGIDFLLHCVVDMMSKGGNPPAIEEVKAFINELKACWKMLDDCDVDPDAVLRAKQRDGGALKTPAYLTPAMQRCMLSARKEYSRGDAFAGTSFGMQLGA